MTAFERIQRAAHVAGHGLKWGIAIAGVWGVAHGSTGCSSPAPAPAADPPTALHGLYAASDAGIVAALEFDDDTHYRLWRNQLCPAPDAATNADACVEGGTYTVAHGTLVLSDARTAKLTRFSMKVLSTHPDIVVMNPGSGLIQGPSAVVNAVQVTPENADGTADGPGQGIQLVSSTSILMHCGTDDFGTIRTVLRPCGGPIPNCGAGTPLAGKPPTGGIGQGFC